VTARANAGRQGTVDVRLRLPRRRVVSSGRFPSQVRFPGLPRPRWWEFEDGSLVLDDLAGEGVELARLPLLEFTLQYGNDWSQFPLEVEAGTLTRVVGLRVTDSFGTSDEAKPVTDPE
jgi:hypothetical protein